MYKFLVIILLFATTVSCQNYGRLQLVHSLPNLLEEVSGFESLPNSPLLWAVNDSGNKATVYGYNPETNDIERTIKITNGSNVDWEDVTADSLGNIYIGDFGNNNNYRKDLVIYTIMVDKNQQTFKTEALRTTFTYEDQKKFPPKKKNRNFDAEAFFYKDGHFYLFTRNRSSHFDGTTKLYKLPATPGNHTAQLIGSFKTCNDHNDCQVTAASIDPSGKKIALLNYNKVWVFSEFENDDFFSGKVQEIKLKHSSQKESLSFKDSVTLYIADEQNGSEGGNLYTLSLD